MNYPPLSVSQSEDVPPKIKAAMDFLRFADNKMAGNLGSYPGDAPKDNGRELSKMEKEVYESALTVLLEYFNEPGFGGARSSPNPPPDDPKNRERVNA